MSEIILSAPVRSNLLSLQNTADLLAKTQERLATGLRVNSALDDPSAFFTAAGLNNRASDLNRLLDSVGLAVQTIEAADAGISAITDLVESAQATARQARQSAGPVTPVTAATLTGTVDLGVDAAATTTGTVDLGTDVAAATVGTVDLGTDSAAVNAGTGQSFAGTETLQSLGFSNGETITITTDGGTTTHTIVDNTTEDVDAVIATLTANTEAGVALSGGNVVATASNAVTSVTFGGTGDVTQLGLTTATVEPTNATIGALTGTATLQVGTQTALTLDFDSAITNRAQLEAALGGLTGGTATVNGSNFITVTAGTNTESITIGGTADTGLGLADDATIDPTNATIGALTGAATLQIGTNAAVTLDFDSAISNRQQLETALSGITGGTATVNGSNFIEVTATNNTDAITTGGVADTGLGLGDNVTIQPANATIAALTGTATIQIGSNPALTLDFDSAISNRADLETALGTLTGGTAVLDANNFIQIDATDEADSITVGGTADTGLGLPDNSVTAPVTGTTTNNSTRAALESEFNNLLTQIDRLARDASFNGNNLLQSDDLTVIFNEDGTSSLTIAGVDFDSGGLGITAVAADSFQTNTNIDATLSQLDTAISTLRTQASTFGSNLSVVEVRQDFTKELINVLETGAGGLTLADTNEEGANLLSLQTRQQLSTTSLSLATQAEQNVLRLF